MGAELAAAGEPTRERALYAGPMTAAAMTALGLAVAVWPLSAVVQAGSWSSGATLLIGSVILAGLLVRLLTRRSPAWLAAPAVAIAQLLCGTVAVTAFASGQTGSVGPLRLSTASGAEAVHTISALIGAAAAEIQVGVAPMAATPAIAVAVAAAAAILAMLVDLTLVTMRVPLLAGVVIAVVGAVPGIVAPPGVGPVWFLGLAVVLLLFLHVRFAPPGSAARNSRTAARVTIPPVHTRPLTTVLLSGAAIVTALVVSPLLPLSASGLDVGGGGRTTLSATLDLGADLRRPSPVTALTLITQDGAAPYLRIATLSTFTGSEWRPDHPATAPLAQGLGAVEAPAEVATHSTHTTIRISGIAGSWLPVPYQATAVRGANGTWVAAEDNRTVTAANADAADQNYTVDTTTVVPTLQQISAATAAGSRAPQELRALPDNMPAAIGEDARTVVGGASTDYDKLIALQTWFRTGFQYSLKTPVADGFDGTNVDAVAKFLAVREGYCVHFAGAFALMARSLGMPARIVVGYLPGTATDRRSDDGRVVYQVGTDQLHSWPEVYFSGIGWVPFEPTATRGVPTAFVTASSGTSGSGATPTAGATPLPTSTTTARGPKNIDDPNAGTAGPAVSRRVDPAPVLWTLIAVVVVLLIPAAMRRAQSARRTGRAARGDAPAAWDELRATLQDLRLPAPASESPRVRGARLVREHGVDPAAMNALVRAVERASYARPDDRAPADSVPATSADLRPALATICTSLRRHASWRNRITAALVPRSLLGARLTTPRAG